MHRFILLLGLSILFTSCEQMKEYLKKAKGMLNEEGQYTAVPGDSAAKFLAKTLKDFQTDVAAILGAMTVAENEEAQLNLREAGLLLEDEEKVQEVSEDAAKVLENGQMEKKSFDSAVFPQVEESFFTKQVSLNMTSKQDYSTDTVNWTHAKDEFTVSMLDKMPVRHQGERGTCASFAGIAQIEALVMKAYSSVTSIDLSEQRFYYMSKPENWSSGGDATSGGSDAGSGFAASNGYVYDNVKTPPDSPTDYNIPLETDCPYNMKIGSNDLQIPQAAGCKTGVVKVKNFYGWLKDWDSQPNTAQQIYDFLATNDYPVIVATKLSSNWENTDGMITLKGAGGSGGSIHAAGHAYLVVGAKKIDPAKFPNEGDMCFIVKNSWGTGWGTNGLSCMTLAWFNAWRYEGGLPVVLDVDLDTAKFEDAKKNLDAIPDGVEEADPSKKGATSTAGKKRGRVTIGLADETEPMFLNSIEKFSLAATDGLTLGAWLANGGEYYKVLYKIDGTKFFVRGILDGDKKMTHDIELILDGKYLKFPVNGRTDVAFGEIDTDTKIIKLCSQDYSQVCRLNYDEASESLAIGLTEEEFNRVETEPPYDWKGLDIAGYGIEVSHPTGINTNLDVRLTVKGKTTNPLRFKIDVIEGFIMYQGVKIGNYQNAAFCSGDYASICRIVVAGDKFHVLFKAKK